MINDEIRALHSEMTITKRRIMRLMQTGTRAEVIHGVSKELDKIKRLQYQIGFKEGMSLGMRKGRDIALSHRPEQGDPNNALRGWQDISSQKSIQSRQHKASQPWR